MNKYVKRALAWICPLTLVFSLSTVFASAADDEKESLNRAVDRDKDYVVAWNTSIYYDQGNAMYLCTVTKQKRLYGYSSNTSWSYVAGYTNVYRGAYSGYSPKRCIVPVPKCYMVDVTGGYMYTAADGSTRTLSYTIPKYTVLCCLEKSVINGVNWYKVRYLTSDSSGVIGWMSDSYISSYGGIV